MSRKVKVPFSGKEMDGTVVSVQQTQEYWNQYLLEDGSVIKMKLVATDIVRVDGQYDKEGNPVYIVKSTNIVSVQAPENLRRGSA